MINCFNENRVFNCFENRENIDKFIVFLFTKRNFLYRFPFDCRTSIGYLIAICLQSQIFTLIVKNPSFTWSFALPSLLYSNTIAKDLKRSLMHMDKNAKKNRHRSHIMGELTEILGLYRSLKRY